MATQLVEVESFQMAVRDPFLEVLISLVGEPNGAPTALHAYETTCAWWDEHAEGPTADELLDSMFEPADWLIVIDDRGRPLSAQSAQLQLVRDWLLLYWCRLGAISFVAGVDLVVRPGSPALMAGEITSARR
ncbi:hypothetical protein [Microbacterium sp. NPDC077184]|uniref:hypothetical protein n=1 Tax=Microbacterium sp. NPDC077184 TaxID=3154764 RepID=UPI0034450622